MSRWVVPERAGVRSTQAEPADGALSRIVKFVPSEVVASFTLLFSVLAAMSLPQGQQIPAAIGLIGLFLVVTILYIALKAPPGIVKKVHLMVSPLAFLAWAYPISSSLLGRWFVGLVSFAAQAVVIAISVFVTPHE